MIYIYISIYYTAAVIWVEEEYLTVRIESQLMDHTEDYKSSSKSNGYGRSSRIREYKKQLDSCVLLCVHQNVM